MHPQNLLRNVLGTLRSSLSVVTPQTTTWKRMTSSMKCVFAVFERVSLIGWQARQLRGPAPTILDRLTVSHTRPRSSR